MLKKLFFFFILSSVSNLLFSQARLVEKIIRKGNEIVIPYEKWVLPNGLTLVIHEDHSDPVVHMDVTYHVGSAREEIGKSGFAHFFEHMMFQGSDNVGDDQHFKIVSESGGTLNGSTNLDRTNYYQTVPSNQLEKMFWLEADRMGFLLDAVTQKKFEIQRSTVKNERGQNYDNVPYGLQREVTSKNLYPYGHPYSWLTIGYLEDLNRSDVNDLKNFFLRWYGPNNATVTVGGDVNTKQVVAMAEKYFGSIPRGPEVKPASFPPVVLEKNRYVSYVDNYARTPRLGIVYPTVPQYHKDQAALACLASIFGQGGGGGRRGGGGGGAASNAVLYQTLVKTQKAQSASAGSSLDELAGEFSFSVTPYPGGNLADMEKGINESLAAFEKRGVTDDDIEKFKSSYEARTINGLASVQGKVSSLAAFQTFTGNPNKISDQLKAYNSLTKADVMRVYEQYIKNKNRLVVSVLTAKDEAGTQAAPDNYTIDASKYQQPDYGYKGLRYVKASDKFNRKIMPGTGPNPVVKVPAFWTGKLSNGMQVIGSANNEIPTVAISIYLKGGRLIEAKDLSKAGWTNMFTRMMNDDTRKHSAEEFGLELDKLGSSISVSSTDDAIVFNLQSLTKNLDKTIALLEERMLMPRFNEEAFKRIRRQVGESITNSKTQASTVATNVYAKLNYGTGHLFGLPANGTAETIKNISFSDIQSYYDNYISSSDGRIVIVGDVTQADVISKLNFLNNLQKKEFNLPPVAKGLDIAKTKIFLINIPKAAQTEFRVGMPTNLKYDATGEFYRTQLLNYNLGAAFTSRVNLNLREDKGWTYGARTVFAGDKYGGTFTFSSGIRADATDSALSELVREIKEYATNGIRQDEINFMRKSMGQADARSYETGIQKAAFLSRIQQYDLSPDYVSKQTRILNTITKPELDALAKKYLDVNKMNILLVGDKAKILPGLLRSGFEIVELDTEGNVIATAMAN